MIKDISHEEKLNRIKELYVYNENKVEGVKEEGQKKGLEVLYDYINKNDINNFGLAGCLLTMHQKLFSKSKYPEVGGGYRKVNNYIKGTSVETSDYTKISKDIHELSESFKDLLERSHKIKNTKNKKEYQKFINEAIDIKCRLIEIHPFVDGNGRTCRALLNYLLKQIDILPLYIDYKEKEIYIDSMNDAIVNKNKEKIYNYYYEKISKSK
jgi:fido (protein-threonine AMPylation protein)